MQYAETCRIIISQCKLKQSYYYVKLPMKPFNSMIREVEALFNRIMALKTKLSPKKRRVISVIIIIAVAVGSAYALLSYILPYIVNHTTFTKMTTTEAIASVAVVATITIAAANLTTNSLKKRYETKKQLTLSVKVSGKKAIITSTIENTGNDRITPKSFYLFINEGRKIDKKNYVEYEFPNILKHECGEFDCALAKKCKIARLESIPVEILGENFKDSLSICNILNHIASDSVNFIDPGEIFSEDTIFELPAGVYRVILVGVTVEADCMCAHKIFIIEEE